VGYISLLEAAQLPPVWVTDLVVNAPRAGAWDPACWAVPAMGAGKIASSPDPDTVEKCLPFAAEFGYDSAGIMTIIT
jgi:hypothetical protein